MDKTIIIGTWRFYVPNPNTPNECVEFSGTYKEYLDYCERTSEYAGGRYCNNISKFRPNCIEQDGTPISYTKENWVRIEDSFEEWIHA